jgi:hypothetical protein
MKIVSRPDFLKLPPGTVFSRYTPCVFTGLRIKGETVGQDFTSADLVGAVAWGTSGDYFERCAAMERGRAFPANFEAFGLDMEFEPDAQLYGVYDATDVTALISTLRPGAAGVREVLLLDGSWDGAYLFYINRAQLQRVDKGELTIHGTAAMKDYELHGQRKALTGAVTAAEAGVTIRWDDDGSFWLLHRTRDGAHELKTIEGTAQLVRKDD